MDSGEYHYVEMREGVRYVRGSHARLESLVWLWRDGQSAEATQEAYPTLRLAVVYGTLAYYLDHQAEVDQELAESQARFEAQRAAAEAADPARYANATPTLRQRYASASQQPARIRARRRRPWASG